MEQAQNPAIVGGGLEAAFLLRHELPDAHIQLFSDSDRFLFRPNLGNRGYA